MTKKQERIRVQKRSAYRCAECGTINHKKSCAVGEAIRKDRAQRLKICKGFRDNGSPCGNKMLRGSEFCHCHDIVRIQESQGLTSDQKQKVSAPPLFCVLFLYGLRTHWNDSHPWAMIARNTFQGLLTERRVRTHYVSYQRWENEHKKMASSQSIDSLKNFFAMPSTDHFFRHFSLSSLSLLAANQCSLSINGVMYKFTDTDLVRLDPFPFPQKFLHLQAFDGYQYDVKLSMMVPLTTHRHCVQVECQSMLHMAGRIAAAKSFALGEIDTKSQVYIKREKLDGPVGTNMDSSYQDQGSSPLVLDKTQFRVKKENTNADKVKANRVIV